MNFEAVAQPNRQGDTQELGALLAVLTNTWTVHLFKSGWAPSYFSLEADFVAQEADFVGYAAVTMPVIGAVSYNSNNEPVAYSANALFTCTSNATPNSIAGLWIEDAALHLYRWFLFNNPVNITTAGQAINVLLALQASQLGYADVSF